MHPESPEVVYGRLLEDVHMAGHATTRGLERLEYLLEGDRWRTLGFDDPDAFVRSLKLSEYRRNPEDRRRAVAALAEAGAGQRAIAEALEVGKTTIVRDQAANGVVHNGPLPDVRKMANGSELVHAGPPRAMLTLYTHKGKAVAYPEPHSASTFNLTQGPGISWAAWSWNPVTGCLHGCSYCYAREIATSERTRAGFPAGFTPLFHPERLEAPRHTVIPAQHRDDPRYRRVFVCSMADLYGKWVPADWIAQVHASMLASPEWEYLLLTKFPARYASLAIPPTAWVGTSVDEQKRVRLAEDAFREIRGVKVKWLSLEPLREPLHFTDLSMFDWVVIGAQTATHQPDGPVAAFSPPADWVVRITAQAKEAGCDVLWKPNLRSNPGMLWFDEYPGAKIGAE